VTAKKQSVSLIELCGGLAAGVDTNHRPSVYLACHAAFQIELYDASAAVARKLVETGGSSVSGWLQRVARAGSR
jgi:hypothetical protein